MSVLAHMMAFPLDMIPRTKEFGWAHPVKLLLNIVGGLTFVVMLG